MEYFCIFDLDILSTGEVRLRVPQGLCGPRGLRALGPAGPRP